MKRLVINELRNRNASLVPDLDGRFHNWFGL
jgi:hypothetical protein